MNSRLKVVVFTHIPSSYQVEFFNALSSVADVSLSVGYIYQSAAHRLWQTPDITHTHLWLDDEDDHYVSARSWMADADLVVFNYYQHPRILELIKERATIRKPWCFWGERPGYRGYGRIGALYRRWRF